MTIKPKHKWKETFKAIQSDEELHYEHNGKKFEVLLDVTEPYLLTSEGQEEYGYVRVYEIKLEDGTLITALEEEVEEFE